MRSTHQVSTPAMRSEGRDKRQLILSAAAACFDRYSVRRTTMDDIAKESGFSRPTVYREFGSKEQIVAKVAIGKSQEITGLVQRAIEGVEGSRNRIVTAIMTCVTFLTTDRQAREVMDGDFRDLLLRSSSEEVVATVTERWTPILTQAMADGTIRPDTDLKEAMIWLTDIQILLAVRKLAHQETEDDIRREIERYILDGLATRK